MTFRERVPRSLPLGRIHKGEARIALALMCGVMTMPMTRSRVILSSSGMRPWLSVILDVFASGRGSR